MPPAPAHLSAASTVLWDHTVERYVLEPHHLELLRLALEAADRAAAAQQQLDGDGLFILDRWGCPRAHPAIRVKEQAETLVARMWRELRLDDPPEPPRPPRQGRTT
jgi:hypothetical protein